jgi:hypothetical protein
MHLVPARRQLRCWSDCEAICEEDRGPELLCVAFASEALMQKLKVVFELMA